VKREREREAEEGSQRKGDGKNMNDQWLCLLSIPLQILNIRQEAATETEGKRPREKKRVGT
jgi:hypothetical protein